MPDGQTILAPLQMEAHGCTVMDSTKAHNDGKQPYIQSPDGYRIPLNMRQGLLYADIRPVLDSEWDTLLHVHLTDDTPWEPNKYDHEVDPEWMTDEGDPVEEHYKDLPYDRHGDVQGDDVDDDKEPTT